MTPISEMTNAELDELIAKLRGWKQDEDNPIEAWKIFWIPPDKDGKVSEYLVDCPSPTTDPRCAMELLEEMLVGGGHYLRYIPERKAFGVGRIENENAYRTISIAYAQWKGEK